MTPDPQAVARTISAEAMEAVLVGGNLAAMRPADSVQYYQAVCESLGLNPLTQPFAYLNLNGKLVLYAKRDCTDQLRRINNISITIPAREVVEGCYIVTARAQTPQNRQDESLGAVPIDGLKGEARSNAMMKAETKAKRRVTLSICGLAFLDESELDSVQGAVHVTVDPQGQITSGTKECAQAVAESKIAGKTPLISAPKQPAERFIPPELTKVFERMLKEPAHFAEVCEMLMHKLEDEQGNDGRRKYDTVADKFAARFSGKNQPGPKDLQNCILDLWEAADVSPKN